VIGREFGNGFALLALFMTELTRIYFPATRKEKVSDDPRSEIESSGDPTMLAPRMIGC
jgi:hypothetical protein